MLDFEDWLYTGTIPYTPSNYGHHNNDDNDDEPYQSDYGDE